MVKKQSFMRGTLVLLLSGFVSRILGFVPRIALPRLIGAEGVGLVQMGYPLLMLMVTIVVGGLPTAVAKMVAESEALGRHGHTQRIFLISIWIAFLGGSVLTLVCFMAAPFIGTLWLTDARVVLTLQWMSPMILLISLSAVLRGYFQGLHNMMPTAVSQTVEALVRIVFVLLMAWWWLPFGLAYAAAGAMVGGVIGEAISLMVLIWYWVRRKPLQPKQPEAYHASKLSEERPVFRSLYSLAVPATGSRLVGSAVSFIESVLIVRCLAVAGVAAAVATAQYGVLQGMIIPLLVLPGVLTYALSVSLVPAIADLHARGRHQDIRRRLDQSVRVALLSGTPFVVLIFILAEPICALLYGQPEAGLMLRWLAPAGLFIYLRDPLQAALQALHRPGIALINTVIGALAKLLAMIFLATRPEWGMTGVLLSLGFGMALVAILHARSIQKLIGYRIHWTWMGQLCTVIVGMGTATWAIYTALLGWPEWIRLTSASSFGLLSYAALLMISRITNRHDWAKLLSWGKRL